MTPLQMKEQEARREAFARLCNGEPRQESIPIDGPGYGNPLIATHGKPVGCEVKNCPNLAEMWNRWIDCWVCYECWKDWN